jgi:predicted CxxxxCH...CXXCH cytochrome family protein
VLIAAQRADSSRDDPLPEYITGDECLFCHRFDTAKSWQDNRHQQTIRAIDRDSLAIRRLRNDPRLNAVLDAADFMMGHKNTIRLLKKSEHYGRLELLNLRLISNSHDQQLQVVDAVNPKWDSAKFGSSCAGCHTTQTDSRNQSFTAISLDCYTCHGNATLEHTTDTTKILFARSRKEPAGVVISTCGQCHLRAGHSRTTRLPYPNNYVAGTDLFADFDVDFRLADDPNLNPADRHVYWNARSVIERGSHEVTCSSCHSVHGQSTQKHRRLPRSEICSVCHDPAKNVWKRPPLTGHSDVCGY